MAISPPGIPLWRGRGCTRCRGTGYVGRTGIYEVLIINKMVQEMIWHEKTAQEITNQARAAGHLRTLKEDAAWKISSGITTFEEAASAVME